MRRGDEALDNMSPPGDEGGRQTSVEMYEVGLERNLE